MKISLTRCMMAIVLIAFISVASAAPSASSHDDTSSPSAAAMAFDAVVVRPLSLVATVVGTGLFIISLPFHLGGESMSEADKRLIVEPAQYTFQRPLGEFDAQLPARN